MTSANKKTSNKGKQKRVLIREAAYRCFRESGYHDTSVDTICDKAGCSKGSFYWHYKSKQEVYIEILHNWAQEVISELFAQFEDAMSKPNFIEAIAEAMKAEVVRGRAVVPLWLEFTVYAQRDKEIKEALEKFYRRARSAIYELLHPFAYEIYGEDEIQGLSTAIFGVYTGLVIQDIADPERVDAQKAVDTLMPVIGGWLQQLRQQANS